MRICLLSLTVISDDPRVRGQGNCLAAAGHDVRGVGLAGGRSSAPSWPLAEVSSARGSIRRKALAAIRGLAGSYTPWYRLAYWTAVVHKRVLRAALREPADLYIANDWRVLPIAAVAAQRSRSRFAYDSHEYAVDEGSFSRVWRISFPRYIRRVESKYIGDASYVSTVSEGIAQLLQRDYGLPERPAVVRNLPAYEAVPTRPTTPPYTVLFHGSFMPDRSLEALIASVALWREEFRLVLRGSGSKEYTAKLCALAAASPAADRITVEPPVPRDEVIRAASAADIGIHPLAAIGDQQRFALPNKLFEYTMAGLALCVADLPAMADVVGRYELGVTIASVTPEGIAAAIHTFDQESIGRAKSNALAAARELNWERESKALVALVSP